MEHSSDNSRGPRFHGGRRFSAGRRNHRGPRHEVDRRPHMHPERRPNFDHQRFHDVGSPMSHHHHAPPRHGHLNNGHPPLPPHVESSHLVGDGETRGPPSMGFGAVSQNSEHSMSVHNQSLVSGGGSRSIMESNPGMARRDDQMRFPPHISGDQSIMRGAPHMRRMDHHHASSSEAAAEHGPFTMPVPSPSLRSSTQPIPMRGGPQSATGLTLAAPPVIPFPGAAAAALGAGSVPLSSVPMSTAGAANAAANQLLFQQLLAQQMSQPGSQGTQPVPGLNQSSAATVASLNALSFALAQQQEKQQLWREASSNGRTVWVGNLRPSVSKQSLRRFFEKCGAVESIEIPKRMADTKMVFAYIRYSNRPLDEVQLERARKAAEKSTRQKLENRSINNQSLNGPTSGTDDLLAQTAQQTLSLEQKTDSDAAAVADKNGISDPSGDASPIKATISSDGGSGTSASASQTAQNQTTDEDGSAAVTAAAIAADGSEEASSSLEQQSEEEASLANDERIFMETGEIPLGYHCAKNAVDRLNYAVFDGHEIHVEFLNAGQNWLGMPRLEYMKYLEMHGCKVYLKGLSYKIRSRDLLVHFNKVCSSTGGRVVSVYVARYSADEGVPPDNRGLAYARGSGYILYDNPQAAHAAVVTLNGSRWQGVGEPISVEPFFSPLTKYGGVGGSAAASAQRAAMSIASAATPTSLYVGRSPHIIGAETSQFGGLNIPSYVPSSHQGLGSVSSSSSTAVVNGASSMGRLSVGSSATSADDIALNTPKTVVRFANVPRRYAEEESFKKFLELNGIWVTTVMEVSVSAPQSEVKEPLTAQMRVKQLVEQRLKEKKQSSIEKESAEKKNGSEMTGKHSEQQQKTAADEGGQQKGDENDGEKATKQKGQGEKEEKDEDEQGEQKQATKEPASPIFTVEVRFKNETSAIIACKITSGLRTADDSTPANLFTIVTSLEREPPATPAAAATSSSSVVTATGGVQSSESSGLLSALNGTSMPIPSVSNASVMSGSTTAPFSFAPSSGATATMFGTNPRIPVTSTLISQAPPGVPTFKPASLASLPQSSAVMATPPGLTTGVGRMGQPTMKPPTPAQRRPLKKSAFLPVHTPAKPSLL